MGGYFDILKTPPRERTFIAFDVETRTSEWVVRRIHGVLTPVFQELDFILGVIFDGKEFFVYQSRHKMIRALLGHQWHGHVAWATNLEFDINALFPHPEYPIERFKFGNILKWCRLVQTWRTTKAGKRVPKDAIYFWDTLNHWPASVAKIGEVIGLPKLDPPWDPDKGPTEVTSALIEYCKRDTEITYRLAEKMQDIYLGLGATMKSSIAGTAMDLFRRRYMDDRHVFRKWPSRGPNSVYLRDFYRTYYGGRTEVFVLGRHEDVQIADVNSMYPSIMRDTKLPILGYRGADGKIVQEWPRTLGRIPDNDDLQGIAYVQINVPEPEESRPDCPGYYPPLPIRRNKIYFPVGRWKGAYTLLDLRYAESVGVKIEKVYYAMVFERSDYLFREYVDDLYSRRKVAETDLENMMYKLLMNALYGKFGMNGTSLKLGPEGVLSMPIPMGQGWFKEEAICQRATYSNFIWASYITSGARCRLHEYLLKYEAFYTDTDSAFTNLDVSETEDLGGLSLQEHVEWSEIWGPKMYSLSSLVSDGNGGWTQRRDTEGRFRGESIKVKGVPRKVAKRLQQTYEYEKFLKFSEAIRRKMKPNSKVPFRKVLTRVNDKRFFHPEIDGQRQSRPWTFREIADLKPLEIQTQAQRAIRENP